MTQLTTLDELERHLILLDDLEVSDALFVSCYLDLEDGAEGGRAALTERVNLLRSTLPSNDLAELGRALGEPLLLGLALLAVTAATITYSGVHLAWRIGVSWRGAARAG